MWGFAKQAVGVTTDNTLSVVVDDEDGDAVAVTWTASAGLLNDPQGATTMAWTAPATRQTVTITATASDGNGGTAAVTETIETATRKTNNFTGNTTWTMANSPYLLEPSGVSATVINSASLTIEAGVEIFVKPAITWFVEGSLTANGSAAQPVVIKPNTRTLEPGVWKGIDGIANSSTPEIELNHVEISYAEKAVFAKNTTNLTLDGCKVTFSSQPAIHHQSSGALMVVNSIITNNDKSGIQVDGSNLPASITITGDSIAFNGDLFSSTPHAEGEAAISVAIADPSGAIPFVIRDNSITRNGFTGIRLGDPKHFMPLATFPVISGNDISGNEFSFTNKIQIRLERPYSGTPDIIDARNNFWGQAYATPADSVMIKAGIIDDQDDPGNIQVRVVVNPWLNTYP